MPALRLYAGPKALEHLRREGLQPEHVRVMPGAAGGPKGLILGPLDRFIFGPWLGSTSHEVHLVGASIGAWRMATACLDRPVAGFERLEHDYIGQHYELQPGQKRPTARFISDRFAETLSEFYDGRVDEVLSHPRYRLHIIASRGRHVLHREQHLRTHLGYLGAFLSNSVHRRALGGWLERVVFSSAEASLPFGVADYRTRQVALDAGNFALALQASCSIPFALRSVPDIPGAPAGAYWDGGITDYHLHLDYHAADAGLVLYPHFQKAVVPGWLDKGLRRRHRATAFLDRVLLLAPDPEWISRLPNGKLPDRNDFMRYGPDLAGRVKAWSTAAAASRQLADEFEQWLARPDISRVEAL